MDNPELLEIEDIVVPKLAEAEDSQAINEVEDAEETKNETLVAFTEE